MQKKLTILFAFAIFVLVVVLQTDSYACDKGVKHKTGDPCGGGGGGGGGEPESATLSLLGLERKTMFATDIPVTVSRDTDKWLSLVNADFNGAITLQFDVSDCFQAAGDFGDGDVTRFKDELGGEIISEENDEEVRGKFTVINTGFLQIKRDRKKHTGILVIDYMGDLGGNGTQITFPGYFSDTYMVSDETEPVPDKDIIDFIFTGTIYLRQFTPGGAQTDPQLGCNLPGGTGPDQSVTVRLDRSAP
ncbi:MAG: hypothetical protein O7B35_08290 [Deltaproteobacteria bacterium]|nr:hypothetical protein [Deltaproteobacteria bacterium]